jgi:DNA polymerase I-like protein with 3'-5' exonuclease and polymerase domains
MIDTIKVTYEKARNSYSANLLLNKIKQYPVIACDFEVAVKFTDKERKEMEDALLDEELPKLERVRLEAALKATALDHPSYCTITHLSIAWSTSEAAVFILDNAAITKLVLNYLVTTEQKQVWHNLSYDAKYLLWHTGKFPKNYEDTQIFAKTLINHVETHKAKTGLKELAGHVYGAWGISSDNFDVKHMYDEHVLLYAASDSCATYWLWEEINRQCDELDDRMMNTLLEAINGG